MKRAERALLAEIDRAELVYSVFRPDSELERWRRGPAQSVESDDLVRLLGLALDWQRRSGGTFNPAVGFLTDRWQRASTEQMVPSDDELADLAARCSAQRYMVEGRTVTKLGDCSRLNFNALAKGLVVDLAARYVVERFGPSFLLVNVGGDLVHYGASPVRVAIEDPQRAYDNASPMHYAHIANCGLATSGSARRWFTVNGRRFSHVIDPSTGRPVDHIASATVVAPDAATADVLATVASVASPSVAASLIDSATDAACLIVDADGNVTTSKRWDALTTYRVVT